jgi:hypothetical protein
MGFFTHFSVFYGFTSTSIILFSVTLYLLAGSFFVKAVEVLMNIF